MAKLCPTFRAGHKISPTIPPIYTTALIIFSRRERQDSHELEPTGVK
jgi:hypothetical protein